jgi:hypothetical protein
VARRVDLRKPADDFSEVRDLSCRFPKGATRPHERERATSRKGTRDLTGGRVTTRARADEPGSRREGASIEASARLLRGKGSLAARHRRASGEVWPYLVAGIETPCAHDRHTSREVGSILHEVAADLRVSVVMPRARYADHAGHGFRNEPPSRAHEDAWRGRSRDSPVRRSVRASTCKAKQGFVAPQSARISMKDVLRFRAESLTALHHGGHLKDWTASRSQRGEVIP